jgi:hypothetical protein
MPVGVHHRKIDCGICLLPGGRQNRQNIRYKGLLNDVFILRHM